MIIKSICLENFGKFHDKTLEFSPGMNLMYGENEAGKTTLHTFIKGMLFGMDSRHSKGVDSNEYEKYIPWETPDKYRGSMIIEAEGVEYRIERNFLKSESSCKIFRTDSGRQLSKAEIDELFYGFDESCYYNTISISQLGSITNKDLEKVLRDYASNLGSTKTMDISIDGAMEELDQMKEKIRLEGNVNKKEEYREEVEDILEEIRQAESEERVILNEMEENREKILSHKAKIKALEELENAQTEKQIKHNIDHENLLQKMEMVQLDIDRIMKSKEQAMEHASEVEKELSEIGITTKVQVEKEIEKLLLKSNLSVLWIVVMILSVIIAGVFLGLDYSTYGYLKFDDPNLKLSLIMCTGIFGFALVMFIITFFVRKARKKRDIQILKNLKVTVDKLDAAKHEADYADKQIRDKQKELNTITFNIKAEKEEKEEVSNYDSEKEELKEQINILREDRTKSQFVLEQKKENILKLKKQYDKLNEKIKKVDAVIEEIVAIDDAKKTIQSISNEVRASFGRELNKKASVYMSNITNGKYSHIDIDENLNMSVETWKGRMVPVDRLSKGTIEQMYMSLRLAAADVIFKEDKKPILLDDAFVMYDNKRMANTLKFMATNLDQVLIFSCHTREKVMADKLKIDYNLMIVDGNNTQQHK